MASRHEQMKTDEFINLALRLLEVAGMEQKELVSLRQEALKILNQQSSPDNAHLSEYITKIDTLLVQVGEALIANGFSAAHQGVLQQAEDYLKLGLMFAELQANDSLLAFGLIGMGLMHKKRSDLLSAEKCYLQSLTIIDESGNLGLKSAALDNLANVYVAMNKPEQALECYDRALAVARESNDLGSELTVLNNLSMVYRKKREFDHAIHILHQVIKLAHKMGNFDLEATAMDNVAVLLMEKGELDEAEQYRLQSLQIFSKLRMPFDEYVALSNLSDLYLAMGKKELAGSYFEKAADLIYHLRSNIDIDRYTIGRHQVIEQMERKGLGQLTNRWHEVKEAMEKGIGLEALVEMYPELHYVIGMGSGEEYLRSGSEHLEYHRYEQAERDLKLAMAAFHRIEAYSKEVVVSNELGVLYLEIGEASQALQWLLHARKLAYEVGDLLSEVNAFMNLAHLYTVYRKLGPGQLNELDLLTQAELLLNLWPEVIKWHAQHEKHQEVEDRDSEEIARSEEFKAMFVYNNLGGCHWQHGSYRRAESYYLRAVEAAQRYWAEGDNGVGIYRFIYRLLNLYKLYRSTSEVGKSQQVLEQIKEVMARSDDLKGNLAASIILGEHYRDVEGDPEQAYEMFKKAVGLSDALRVYVPYGEERISFIDHISPPFQSAVSLAVQLRYLKEAFDSVNRSKSRRMLEMLAETLPPPVTENILSTLVVRERHLFSQWLTMTQILKEFVPDKPDRSFHVNIYDVYKEVQKTQNELSDVWKALEQIDPEYVSLRRAAPLQFTEVLSILSAR